MPNGAAGVIRYLYNMQVQPPAPFVLLSLRNPADGRELRGVPAQIDSAADLTVMPDQTVQALGLSETGRTLIAGLGGTTFSARAYVVHLGVHDFPTQPVKVVSSADEPWVLLGRDVLNSRRFVLDGPGLALEVG